MGRMEKTFIALYYFSPLANIQTFVFSFSYKMTTFYYQITGYIIAMLLLNEIYQPLEISSFNLLVHIMSDLITAISYRQVVDLNSHQLSSYNYRSNLNIL